MLCSPSCRRNSSSSTSETREYNTVSKCWECLRRVEQISDKWTLRFGELFYLPEFSWTLRWSCWIQYRRWKSEERLEILFLQAFLSWVQPEKPSLLCKSLLWLLPGNLKWDYWNCHWGWLSLGYWPLDEGPNTLRWLDVLRCLKCSKWRVSYFKEADSRFEFFVFIVVLWWKMIDEVVRTLLKIGFGCS